MLLSLLIMDALFSACVYLMCAVFIYMSVFDNEAEGLFIEKCLGAKVCTVFPAFRQ